jgi:AraC-like DNA-binding protein
MAVPNRLIHFGLDRLPAGLHARRHQHVEAYATIVLKGAYEQLAFAGRLRLEAGDVIIQPTFDCHASRMKSPGLEILRLPWRREPTLGGVYRGCHVDTIVEAARRDLVEASQLMAEKLASRAPAGTSVDHWADALAGALAANTHLRIAEWAERAHLSRERVSRGFFEVYGVSPGQFRSELKARAAWFRVTGTADLLSKIAVEAGFSDQAHMARMVKAFTGAPPIRWRASHSFKASRDPSDITRGRS